MQQYMNPIFKIQHLSLQRNSSSLAEFIQQHHLKLLTFNTTQSSAAKYPQFFTSLFSLN